jgi:protein-disulfide isomerase
MKVHAVPVFLVNGKYVGGVADPAVLRRVVQEAVTEGRRSARM